MQETWVPSLSQEDSLEKGRAPHSHILAWRIPWTEEAMGCSLWGRKESDATERAHTRTHTHTHTHTHPPCVHRAIVKITVVRLEGNLINLFLSKKTFYNICI